MIDIEIAKPKSNRWRTAFIILLGIFVAGVLFLHFQGLNNVWQRGYRAGYIKGATNGFQTGIDTGRDDDCKSMSECSGNWSIEVDLETLEAKWTKENQQYIYPYDDYPFTEHDK